MIKFYIPAHDWSNVRTRVSKQIFQSKTWKTIWVYIIAWTKKEKSDLQYVPNWWTHFCDWHFRRELNYVNGKWIRQLQKSKLKKVRVYVTEKRNYISWIKSWCLKNDWQRIAERIEEWRSNQSYLQVRFVCRKNKYKKTPFTFVWRNWKSSSLGSQFSSTIHTSFFGHKLTLRTRSYRLTLFVEGNYY